MAVNRGCKRMIELVKGNLLLSNCTIVAQVMNCQCKMNFGLAKQVKSLYPEVYQADLNFKYQKDEKLGKCSFALSEDGKKVIFNLYAQAEEEGQLHYDALEKAFENMMLITNKLELKGFKTKIGVPYFLGCTPDDGNGSWKLVNATLEKMAKRYDRTIYTYRSF